MCQAVVGPIALAGARADFERARRGYLAARARRLLRARRPSRTRPRDLGDIAALLWHSTRLRSIPLDAIVGTVDATSDFDAGFRPAAHRVSRRWQRVALAHRDGRPLPPIAVIERPDGYYVLDGRHRVSVARALGHGHIDAWASPSVPAGRALPHQSPPTREKPMSHLIHEVLGTMSRRLRPSERVHVHAGDHGRPYVCEDARCNSPALHYAAAGPASRRPPSARMR
ncbi:MAG: hypothetical protein QOC68_1873 [Solirubrobacteraceae bacterium]|jgi:hypothetical protein|nr:hypothetical protein [Solirubrobacteraceae bacterium]